MSKKILNSGAEDDEKSRRKATSPVSGATVPGHWESVQECVLVAQVLVDQYGNDAPLKAEASASKLLLDWADLEAWAYWKRAGRAAKQLLQTEPGGSIH